MTSSQKRVALKPSARWARPPAHIVAVTTALRAVTWKSGNIEYAVSSCVRPRISSQAAAFQSAERLACMTPLARPVVPLVYMM